MKKGIIIGVILLLMGIMIVGCTKDEIEGLTDEQIEEIIRNAEQVMADVTEYYEASDSLSDMAPWLDTIKAMEFVEDAWIDDISIGVKITDGGIITWNFFDNDTSGFNSDTSYLEDLKKLGEKGSITVGTCSSKTACIAISSVSYSQLVINEIKTSLETHGYTVSQVSGNEFSPFFICEVMPNYGANIILAHGGYNPITGSHRIITGEQYNVTRLKEVYDDWFKDGMEISSVKEYRGGSWQTFRYLAVTERFIGKKMKNKFPDNSFMFASVCSTLEGNCNFADTLIKKKNLGCFLGYNGEVSRLRSDNTDLRKIMKYMLDYGYTAREAYSMVGSGTNPQLLLRIPTNRDVRLYEDKNVFSVSSTKKVKFATSNLSTNGQFCANPWDAGASLTWSASYGNNWRTLSQSEWSYLFRRAYEKKYALGMVNNVKGLILLPDQWSLPQGCSFNAAIGRWDGNVYSKEKWAKMQANGAVFLPVTDEGYYSQQYFAGGYYWTGTQKNNKAAYVLFTTNFLSPTGRADVDSTYFASKTEHFAVRLVRNL